MSCPITPADWRVFNAIRAAAERRAPCPSNIDLAMLIGWESVSSPPASIAKLERLGLITVERCQKSRVITITQTGAQTARLGHSNRPHVARGRRIAGDATAA